MSAADVVVSGPTVVKQLTGRRDEQYDPFPTVGVMNGTLDLDLHGIDIGVNWTLGYDNKFCVWGGDGWGSTWRRSQFTLQDLTHSVSAAVHALQTTRAANSFLGRSAGLDTVKLDNTAGLDPDKLVCFNCGGSEGWSVFRFASKTAGPGGLLEGVEYLGGAPAGSVAAGVVVTDGDPRTHGTYRGNVMAISSDTDHSDGIGLSFYSNSAGFASGYAMEAAEFVGSTLELGDVYPYFPHSANPATSGPLFGVTKIERVGGSLTFTSTGHGQANTGPYPRGPLVYVAGAPSTTLHIGAGHTTASSTITLAAGYTTAGLSVAAAPSDDRRFVVLNTLGQVVKFAYTGLGGGGTTITGVTLISGSGTLATGATLIQGVDDINLSLQQVWDYPTANTIRATSFAADRIGGTSSFCFLHVPNIDVSNPATGARNGWFPTGGFSAAHTGSHRNFRQFVAMFNSTYGAACTSIDYLYTDDDLESAWPVHGAADGFNWTRAGSWLNDTDGTGPVQGVCFFDDPANVMGGGASTYKYAFFSPGTFIGRIPLANAHTFSAWEYWTGSTWSSNIANAARVTTFDTFFWGSVNETAQSVSIQYDADLGCFVMMYGYGFVVNVRCADDPRATWTRRTALSLPAAPNTNSLDINPVTGQHDQGYQYGGFMLQPTGSTPTGRKRFLFTQFKPYQIYEGEVQLVGTPPTPGVDTTMRNDSVDRQSKTGQKFRSPTIDKATSRMGTGWLSDDKTWQIVDSLTIRCADASADVATYLEAFDPMSINDGTAVRYFHALAVTNNGTNTTVTLVPHNDGASAGNVLTTGGTVSAMRYAKQAFPQGFPTWFNYTMTLAGWSVNPTNIVTKYMIVGHACTLHVRQGTAGTSNNATHTGTLPVTAKTHTNEAAGTPATCLDNGVGKIGLLSVVSAATTATLLSDFLAGANTASGSSRFTNGQVTYEI